MHARSVITIILGFICLPALGQEDIIIDVFPFEEDFESVTPPALPAGWETSTNRTEDGDFTVESFQGNNRLSTRNATIAQYIITPIFDFTGYRPASISFTERRSGTFGAVIEVRAILHETDTLVIGTTQLTDANTFVPLSFNIPQQLLHESNVRFALQIIPDEEGTAGTLRFDNVQIDAAIQHTHELRLTNVQISPPLPVTDDSLQAAATILNAGLEPASSFTVGIRSDDDRILAEKTISDEIVPEDSVTAKLTIMPLPQNIHSLQVYVEYERNEGSETSINTDVHIAEPVRSYPYIEHFNYTDDALPLQWRSSIRDDNPDASLTTSIVHEGERTIIMSNATQEQYLLLPPLNTSDGILQELTFFERRTGTFDATLYIDVSTDRGKHFQEYASFSHSGETDYIPRVLLLDEFLSDEDVLYIRLRLAGDGTGTTGTIRFDSFTATARMDHDIAVSDIMIDPPLPLPDEAIEIAISVGNFGLQPAQNFTINVYRIHTDEPELIGSHEYLNILHPFETATVSFIVDDMPAGYSLLRAEADYPPDILPDNNVLDKEIFIRYPSQILIINEILYHTRDGQPEFVEIYNPGETEINLNGWSIRDRETPGGQINQYLLSDTTLYIEPGSFAVLAADSSIFDWFGLDGTEALFRTAGRVTLGLSSLGDEVMLLDPSGSVVDSVAYDPSWHHPDIFETQGRSLERISPNIESQSAANWSTTADPLGGTPGKHNSIFTDTPVTTASIEVNPNPFSPNADGFEDHTIISYNLPQQTAMVRLRIFDSLGRHIRTLLNNQPSGPTGNVIWDGRNENGQNARLGIYVILLEAYDGNRTGLTQVKSTVVVADRL